MNVEPSVKRIGRYVVIGLIGSGGMGDVFLAHDDALDRDVAIKILRRSNLGPDAAQIEKYFRRERTATASFQHPNIVSVLDSGEQDGNPYLVMEYLRGKSLAHAIEERSPMPLTDKLDVLVQVCEGLQYAHNRDPQIIHRDIKPANVILLTNTIPNPRLTAKIVDFGIARVVGTESIIQTGQLIGSLSYMSPEQINNQPIDIRTDIYSAGVLLYQLLTYTLPFKGADTGAILAKILREDPAPLSKFLEDVPPGLQECISRAMAKDTEVRYQSAEEFAFDLLQIQKRIRDRTTSELLSRAEHFIKQGDQEKARLDLQEILRLDRQHERANRLLAEVRKTLLNQQKTARITHLNSQAAVALANRQFDQALTCVEQSLQLSPQHQETLELRGRILQATARAKSASQHLRRAEDALQSWDLDQARKSVSAALVDEPDSYAARGLAAVIDKQQADLERRSETKGLVEKAERLLADHRYQEALGLSLRALALDPSATRAQEIATLAADGRDQEQRRKNLQQVIEQADVALNQNDFTAAAKICDDGLLQFTDEATLLRLKKLAESLGSNAEKRKYVQDRLLAARKLTNAANFTAAVECLSAALACHPGEASLQAAIEDVLSEIALRKRVEDDAAARLANRLHGIGDSLQAALDGNATLERLEELATQLKALLAASPDRTTVERYRPQIEQLAQRRSSRNRALSRLDFLLSAVRDSPNAPVGQQTKEEIATIHAIFPNDAGIEERYAQFLDLMRLRDAELKALLTALDAMEQRDAKGALPPPTHPVPASTQVPTAISTTPAEYGADTVVTPKRSAHRDLNLLPPVERRLSLAAWGAAALLIGATGFGLRTLFWSAKPAPAAMASSKTTSPTPGKDSPASKGSGATIPTEAPPPTLATLSQTSLLAGSPGVKLVIGGSGFVAGKTQVLWNGSTRRAKVVTDRILNTELTRKDVAVAGKGLIVIETPAGRSSPLPFSIEAQLMPAHVSTAPPPNATSSASPAPVSMRIDLPVGTSFAVNLEKPLNSSSSQTGESFNAVLSRDVMVNGSAVLKAGTQLKGIVKYAKPKDFIRAGLLIISFRFVHVNGSDYPIRSGGIDSASGRRPQKASDYYSELEDSVYPEKDSLKDALKSAGVNATDVVFCGDLRKDVQLSGELTFRLDAPFEFLTAVAQMGHSPPPAPVAGTRAPAGTMDAERKKLSRSHPVLLVQRSHPSPFPSKV